jgi:hypothetical protein
MQSGPGAAPSKPENAGGDQQPKKPFESALDYPLTEILTTMTKFHVAMKELHDALMEIKQQSQVTQWSPEDQADLATLIRLTEVLSHNPFESIAVPEPGNLLSPAARDAMLERLASAQDNETFQKMAAAATEWASRNNFNGLGSKLQALLAIFAKQKYSSPDINFILLEPLQKPLKYHILLTDLQKKHDDSGAPLTDPESYQHRQEIIQKAGQFFKQMAGNINQEKRKAEIQEDRGSQATTEIASKAVSDAVDVIEGLQINTNEIFEKLIEQLSKEMDSTDTRISKLKEMKKINDTHRPAEKDAMLLVLVDYMDQLGEKYKTKLTTLIGQNNLSQLKQQLAAFKESFTKYYANIKPLLSKIKSSRKKGRAIGLSNESLMFLRILGTQGVMSRWTAWAKPKDRQKLTAALERWHENRAQQASVLSVSEAKRGGSPKQPSRPPSKMTIEQIDVQHVRPAATHTPTITSRPSTSSLSSLFHSTPSSTSSLNTSHSSGNVTPEPTRDSSVSSNTTPPPSPQPSPQPTTQPTTSASTRLRMAPVRKPYKPYKPYTLPILPWSTQQPSPQNIQPKTPAQQAPQQVDIIGQDFKTAVEEAMHEFDQSIREHASSLSQPPITPPPVPDAPSAPPKTDEPLPRGHWTDFFRAKAGQMLARQNASQPATRREYFETLNKSIQKQLDLFTPHNLDLIILGSIGMLQNRGNKAPLWKWYQEIRIAQKTQNLFTVRDDILKVQIDLEKIKNQLAAAQLPTEKAATLYTLAEYLEKVGIDKKGLLKEDNIKSIENIPDKDKDKLDKEDLRSLADSMEKVQSSLKVIKHDLLGVKQVTPDLPPEVMPITTLIRQIQRQSKSNVTGILTDEALLFLYTLSKQECIEPWKDDITEKDAKKLKNALEAWHENYLKKQKKYAEDINQVISKNQEPPVNNFGILQMIGLVRPVTASPSQSDSFTVLLDSIQDSSEKIKHPAQQAALWYALADGMQRTNFASLLTMGTQNNTMRAQTQSASQIMKNLQQRLEEIKTKLFQKSPHTLAQEIEKGTLNENTLLFLHTLATQGTIDQWKTWENKEARETLKDALNRWHEQYKEKTGEKGVHVGLGPIGESNA